MVDRAQLSNYTCIVARISVVALPKQKQLPELVLRQSSQPHLHLLSNMADAAPKREHSQYELPQPPNDVVSAVRFAPDSPSKLLVSSWDRHVYLYDTQEGGDGTLVRKIEHRTPVLDCCWGRTEEEAFSCGLDWDVRR